MKKHRPVYVISGFLGAGKTTFLNRVLRENHGKRFAVIVNEFGEVGIDGSLIENPGDVFVKMDNGCLCCALNAELVETVAKLKDRDDFDAVLLETTGVADPLPISWTFFREQFTGYFRFGGIITIVDALNFERMNQEAIEVLLQIERGDYLYLSKTEQVVQNRLGALLTLLPELNPNARLIFDTDANWMDLIFDLGDEEKSLKDMDERAKTHSHKATYDSIAIPLQDKSVSLVLLEDHFESLPREVFRAKALFTDHITKKNYVMHSVCGRVEFYETNLAGHEEVCVFIGKNLDKEKLKVDLEKALAD
jgi:G3E family GTPase